MSVSQLRIGTIVMLIFDLVWGIFLWQVKNYAALGLITASALFLAYHWLKYEIRSR